MGWVAVAVGVILLATTLLGVYTCASERPARELFFAPDVGDEPPVPLRPLRRAR